MKVERLRHTLPAALLPVLIATGCAGGDAPAAGAKHATEPPAVTSTALSSAPDRATAERILALAPERISAEDVRATLARGPAPRIIAIQGSVPVVTMAPFAEFLIAMGYPAERIRRPAGTTSAKE